MPFIDLKTPYNALKSQIDGRIQAVLDHGQYIMGPEVAECEKDLATFVGSKHAITCASGTDAALMALMALGIGPGDEVITTAFSFIATIETVVLVGATPVLVDIEPETFNIDVNKIEGAITSKTKAIMPVSLYGQPADMDEINALAKAKGLVVIEDAAQSFGAPYKIKRSCALSDFGATSFFPAKPLGCYGDGGAVFTDNDEWAQTLISIRNHGQTERYFHPMVGINGRLDTLQCAILIEKLKRYGWEIEQRERVAKSYTEAFKDMDVKTPVIRSDRQSVWAQYTLRVANRPEFQKRMTELGVPTAVHYPTTMGEQPAYQKLSVIHDISHATQAAKEVVSLPMYPDMSSEIQQQVVEAVSKSLT
ncbi:MAG: DegT/DnrJ/EryC1/StrS family aminotransferase [Bdellovibrionaceae bacterium]|nr:DegT/DnrJ/EryC1/StrS family aminotransferase [Bdellovibrionales bacterium]MCB9084541.1 DegT/DnrJ/EryC1/StrS family aminotransferase [Pseudobdellovibrionaceae bacterium]